jgi:hypothetical protein
MCTSVDGKHDCGEEKRTHVLNKCDYIKMSVLGMTGSGNKTGAYCIVYNMYILTCRLLCATMHLERLSRRQRNPGSIAGSNVVPVGLPEATEGGCELPPKTFFLMLLS